MANIFDYLAWRGDIPMYEVSVNDIDSLILSRAAYLPFDGVVPGTFNSAPMNLGNAAEAVLERCDSGELSLRLSDDRLLLEALASSPRFSELYISGYENIFDASDEEQFSAITILIPKNGIFIAFRGTDGSLVGWKEDFNMAFSDAVPAQVDAVDYLSRASVAFIGPIRIAGHSKGGNLAVYSSIFSREDIQNRIISVRNFDGPGFNENVVASEGFLRMAPYIKTYLPQSSVIGMLLEHTESFSLIDSRSVGIFQHNIYLWEIAGAGFSSVESLTNSSQFVDATLKDWVKNMTPESREKMINGVYEVLSASDGKTLRELWNGKNTIALLRAAGTLDDSTKDVISEAFRMLRSSAKTSIPKLFDRLRLPSEQ